MAESDATQLTFRDLNTLSVESRDLSGIRHMVYAPNGNLAVNTVSSVPHRSGINILHSGVQACIKSYTISGGTTGLSYNPDNTNQLAISLRNGSTYIIDPEIHERLEQGQIIGLHDYSANNAYNAQGTLLAIAIFRRIQIYRSTNIMPLDKLSISNILFLALTNRLQKESSMASFDEAEHPEIAILFHTLSAYVDLQNIIAQKWRLENQVTEMNKSRL